MPAGRGSGGVKKECWQGEAGLLCRDGMPASRNRGAVCGKGMSAGCDRDDVG